ncbi:MAG: DUF4838 domain-containing protein [Armatimonadetes bacterium]|nr:DUF4838 domain-containing protein [Armatimonadota bacterium]
MIRLLPGLFLLIVFATALPAQAADLILAEGGKTTYAIVLDPSSVLPADADGKPRVSPVQHAANELAAFLQQVTGAEFRILVTAELPRGKVLCVGPGKVQQLLAPNLKLDQLKPDGIVIETSGLNLILAGDEPRGTLYAVYTFLEDVVGCRWWSSKASTIPSKPDLTVPEQHVRYIPPLEYRETFWYDAFDGDWAVRNKSNANRAQLDEQRGGKIRYGGPFFVHTFEGLVPQKEFAATHPEYYSERDGKRLAGEGVRTQLCVTNPDVKRIVTERVLAYLAKDPTANIISVSQNDWDAHCLCPECKKLEEYEGSPSGPLLHLVNHVAAEVGKQYPNVAIDTLAYQYTRKPPLHVKPLPNVIVRLCSIECNFAEPLTGETNRTFADDIRGWNQVCDRLYIWDYTTNFGHYIMPHPNQRVLGPNIRFFVDNGVKGIFEQGAYQSHGAEMAELRAWVLAKLLWNPKRDDKQLIDEFLDGYFGPAAAPIRQYLTLLHDSAEKTRTYLSIGVPPTSAFLSFELMSQAEKLFNDAEAAVKDTPDLLLRVQIARLPIRYVWTMRWQEFQAQARKQKVAWPGPADYVENARTFMAISQANKFTKLSEGRPIESFASRTIDLGRTQSPPPPGCENLKEDQWIDLQDGGFSLWREGTGSALKHDDLASDKVAAWNAGNHFEWSTQQWLAVADLDPEATYGVYAAIRCEKAGELGGAFTAGIYDAKNKIGLGHLALASESIKSDKYEVYKIASTKLHDQVYVWVAPTNNPENVKAVWVDRFWLVKE